MASKVERFEELWVPITKGEFESLAGNLPYVRNLVVEEKEWYKAVDLTAVIVLFRDRTDNDFAFNVLLKSEDGYRYDEGRHSFKSRGAARDAMIDAALEIEP